MPYLLAPSSKKLSYATASSFRVTVPEGTRARPKLARSMAVAAVLFLEFFSPFWLCIEDEEAGIVVEDAAYCVDVVLSGAWTLFR